MNGLKLPMMRPSDGNNERISPTGYRRKRRTEGEGIGLSRTGSKIIGRWPLQSRFGKIGREVIDEAHDFRDSESGHNAAVISAKSTEFRLVVSWEKRFFEQMLL